MCDPQISFDSDKVLVDGHASCTIDEMVDALPSQDCDTGIFPNGIKFFSQFTTSYWQSYLAVHEMPPRVAKVEWSGHDLSLSLPYVISILELSLSKYDRGRVCLNNSHVFFRNEPLNSLDDELYVAALTNITPSGAVCLGANAIASSSISAAIKSYLTTFWSSGFNDDLDLSELSSGWAISIARKKYSIPGFFQRIVPGICPIGKWNTRSKKNPRYGLTRKWRPANLTLRQFLKRTGHLAMKSAPLSARKLVNIIWDRQE